MALQFMLKGAGKANKKNTTPLPVFVRYSYNGSECRISAKKKVAPAHWDFVKERPLSSYPGGPTNLGRYLTRLKGEVERAVTDLENEGEIPAPDLVKERYAQNAGGIGRIKVGILAAWKEYLQRGAKTKAPRTILNEKASYNSFAAYLESIGKTGLSLPRLDAKIIAGYGDHLAGCTLNTKSKKLKHFKAFLKDLDHPLTKIITFKEQPGDKIFLTLGELSAIQAHNFGKNLKLDRVRDLFVLQCHTALRVSDLKRLEEAHIGDTLNIRAQKNKRFISLPISPTIKAIFEKYNNRLPVISDQRYNEYIKEVAKDAIPKSKVEVTEYREGKTTHVVKFKHEVLTSHDAVRTYITLKAQMGMPITKIAYYTGKTVAIILRNYLGIDEEEARRDADKYDFPVMKVAK